MLFHELQVAGAYRIDLEPVADPRGFFARAFSRAEFSERGIQTDYPQANISLNLQRGTLRGIHYRADRGEAKLVRCVAGAAYHAIVDLRPDSPTFLAWTAVELSRANRSMLFIPPGCGHGLQTLADDTELHYQMGDSYAPEHDRGLRWDDPTLAIEWPLTPTMMSERDRAHPALTSLQLGVER